MCTRERERENVRARESICVCERVCVSERECVCLRDNVCDSACDRESVHVRVCFCVERCGWERVCARERESESSGREPELVHVREIMRLLYKINRVDGVGKLFLIKEKESNVL